MSFGDQNNPYGAPQGGQPYGQPPANQGYGYPQAPPVSPYGDGSPAMTTMPGTVSTARVLLWVIAGLQVIGVVLFAFAVFTIDQLKDDPAFDDLSGYSTGVLWGLLVLALGWLVWAAVLATKFKSGGSGSRVTILVFGILTAVFAIYPFTVFGIIHLILGVLIAVFAGNANGKAWFNRPRY
ncbi:hypothetical protein ACFXAZ_04360 [Streptomyces sp. NPDC059477]|uniref:hypothetical protein n=1 Tax=Streptomyces sp. NPDC059477 TaxID=3346847 RepID=UPI0036AB05FF